MQLNRGTSSSPRRLNVDITNSVFGENTYIVRDLATYTSYRAAFQVFQRNVWWGPNQFTNVNGPTSNLDNLNYKGLLADAANGDFKPTERSPARYVDPANPTMTVGAVPHAGAEPPAGVHGFWYTDHTFAVSSVTEVTGDMVIAPGVTMTFLPDARFNMATTDAMEGGLDNDRVEIRTEGTLEADGTITRPVILQSGAASPARGDWYGIVILDDTEAFNISQVDLSDAYRGVSLYSNDHIVAGSSIHDCSNAGVWVSGGTPAIEDMTLYDNQRGIYVEGGAVVDTTEPEIRDNDLQGIYSTNSGFTLNVGEIYDNGVASTVDNARFEYSQYGLYLDGPTAPTVEDSVFFHNQSYGVYATGVDSAATRGKVDILASYFIGTGSNRGVHLLNSSGDIRSSYITHTSVGIEALLNQAVTGTFDVYAVNNTIVHQSVGVQYNRNTSSSSYRLNI